MADSRYSRRVGRRMKRILCSGVAGWSSALGLAASIALLFDAGVAGAQEAASTPATASQTTSTLPADPSPPVPSTDVASSANPASADAVANPAHAVPFPGSNLKPDRSDGPLFGIPQTPFPAPAANGFQTYKGFQGRGSASIGAGRQASSLNGFGDLGQVGILGTAGLGLAGRGSLGAGATPNFNQMMRASFSLPLSSSIGTFKLTFRDAMGAGGNGPGGGLGQGTAGGMFSTTNLGNGVFFSAGTNIGKGTMAGTPPGGFGSNSGTTGPKASRPAVTLKLSF